MQMHYDARNMIPAAGLKEDGWTGEIFLCIASAALKLPKMKGVVILQISFHSCKPKYAPIYSTFTLGRFIRELENRTEDQN